MENKALVAAYLLEVDRGNLDALRDFSRPDFVLHLPGFPPLGLEAAMRAAGTSGRRFLTSAAKPWISSPKAIGWS